MEGYSTLLLLQNYSKSYLKLTAAVFLHLLLHKQIYMLMNQSNKQNIKKLYKEKTV